MQSKIRALTAVGATTLAMSALTVATATPAHAATKCTERSKSISTPGFDTDFTVKVCISGGGQNTKGAYIIVGWTDGGDSAADGNRKFDGLRIKQRLERYDDTVRSNSCSIAGEVNRNRSGSATCPTLYHTSSARGGWSADGVLEYNVDRDGKGYMNWNLHGSPRVS